jgi:heme exporter protein B
VADLLRAALAIATKDARVEWRSRTALQSALVFAVLVLVIFNFARDAATVPADLLAPSVLWVTVAFASVIALNRAFAMEQSQGALDALLLAPVSRSAVFVGKYLANLGFVLLVEALTVPVFVLFFNVDLSRALVPIAGLLLLATIGFVAVGTVLSAMTVRTRFAELMLPVLLLPFLVPPVVGAVQLTARILASRPLSELAGWLKLLAAFDVVFFTLSLLLFEATLDE